MSGASKIDYQWMPGPVGEMLKNASLSTTATVPISPTTSLVYTTGHIGLDVVTGELVKDDLESEFNAIFNCLDVALKNAGVEAGIQDAFRIVSYLVKADHEKIMQKVFRAKWPGHTPTWVTVIVAGVVGGDMHGEITADAVLYKDCRNE